MATPGERPIRSVDELDAKSLERLKEAHERLRRAVTAGEPFRAGPLAGKEVETTHEAERLRDAYTEVEEAEAELWRLREELLGWRRPSWAPRASLIGDWFSDEDRVYDDLDA